MCDLTVSCVRACVCTRAIKAKVASCDEGRDGDTTDLLSRVKTRGLPSHPTLTGAIHTSPATRRLQTDPALFEVSSPPEEDGVWARGTAPIRPCEVGAAGAAEMGNCERRRHAGLIQTPFDVCVCV